MPISAGRISADEPVLCLAMAVQGCRAQEAYPANYGIPWEVTEMKCDIFNGLCQYATDWHPLVADGRMIHWSVRYCKKPLYRFEVEKINLMEKYGIRPGKGGQRCERCPGRGWIRSVHGRTVRDFR